MPTRVCRQCGEIFNSYIKTKGKCELCKAKNRKAKAVKMEIYYEKKRYEELTESLK